MASKKGGRKPKYTGIPVDRTSVFRDGPEDAEMTSVEETHPAYTRNWRERPTLSSEDENTNHHSSKPKPFEPVPAAAAAPPPKARPAWVLPSLEDTSPGLEGIPIDDSVPPKASSLRVKAHRKYNDELVTLQVEDTLYRVSAKSLRVSASFSQRLKKKGPWDTSPIKLPNVKVSEMDTFLQLLDARTLYNDLPYFSLSELTSILRLSTGWEFSVARQWAIQKISKITQPAMKRLELAHIYRVDAWLEPAYLELCAQSTAFSAEEMTRLLDMVSLEGLQVLIQLREDYKRSSNEVVGGWFSSKATGAPNQADLDTIKAKIGASKALALRPKV